MAPTAARERHREKRQRDDQRSAHRSVTDAERHGDDRLDVIQPRRGVVDAVLRQASRHPPWFHVRKCSPRTARLLLRKLCDRRAVRGLGCDLADELMFAQLVAHGLAEGTGTAAVNDPHTAKTAERGIVDE